MNTSFDGTCIRRNVENTSRSMPNGIFTSAIQRAPTDALFLSSLTLVSIVPESAYFIVQASNTNNILASGVASGNTLQIDNIQVFDNPMKIEIRIRNSSSAIKYKPLKTYGFLGRSNLDIFVNQVEDTVAQ